MEAENIITARMRKEYSSLDDVKGRRRAGIFVAEGTKCVLELAQRFKGRNIYATAKWIEENGTRIAGCEVTECPVAVLRSITRLSTTPAVIAFFEIPEPAEIPAIDAGDLVLALDRVQDPGNMGTIIRTANWMGVKLILASNDTVDIYNPKTVQATMGALAGVKVCYCNLPRVLAEVDMPVYGTFLDGENIYTSQLSRGGIIVMGNEGSGIGAEVERAVTHRLFIPPFTAHPVESLNVAIAAAVVMSQFRGRL